MLDDMKSSGEPISFLAVARKAEVSNWLVYAEGVREHIESARRSQRRTKQLEVQAGTSASSASLAVDLQLARAELKRVREERDRLRAKVQRGLGQQLDQSGLGEVEARARALASELHQAQRALEDALGQKQLLSQKLDEAENTIGALRSSLRQMMRSQSL
ncbi:DUF6262 family protein [Kitasatospora sp. LaBMicrA B282]|uniref:DUF6262 family protein n=1 Tax=Kitasatospora sp. LaBMicrA B282 TaxID=3420949 RepID=UPI003D0E9C47